MAHPSIPRLILYALVLASLVHSLLSLIRLMTKEAPPNINASNVTSDQIIQMSEWLLESLHPDKQGQEINDDSRKLLQAGFLTLLNFLLKSHVLPFRTHRYPATKGVLDRLPLERFMRQVASKHVAVTHDNCLEWGPFFKGWRGTTQPYLKLFNCTHKWMFIHHPTSGSIKRSIRISQSGDRA